MGAGSRPTRLCGSPHRRPGLEGCRERQRGFPQAGAAFGALLGLAMALMGYATMEDVQTIATVFGHTLIAVVTSGIAGSLIARLLNRGRG